MNAPSLEVFKAGMERPEAAWSGGWQCCPWQEDWGLNESILWLWFFPLGPRGKDGTAILSTDKLLLVSYCRIQLYIFANLSRHRSVMNYQSFYHRSQPDSAAYLCLSPPFWSPILHCQLIAWEHQLSFIKNKFSVSHNHRWTVTKKSRVNWRTWEEKEVKENRMLLVYK